MPSELNITLWSLLGAFSLVIIAIAISGWLKLGTAKEIIIACLRMVIQLIVVGYALTYLFRLDNVWVTLAIVLVMVVNAAYQAAQRGKGLDGVFRISLLAIGSSTIVCLAIPDPFNCIRALTSHFHHRHDRWQRHDLSRSLFPQPQNPLPRQPPGHRRAARFRGHALAVRHRDRP